MPCRQVSTFNGTAASSGSYRTEAECNQACQEGACCDGTSCSVKPQCQCQGAGQVFKGVGTTCATVACRCSCANFGQSPCSGFGIPAQYRVTISGLPSHLALANGEWTMNLDTSLSRLLPDNQRAFRGYEPASPPASYTIRLGLTCDATASALRYFYVVIIERGTGGATAEPLGGVLGGSYYLDGTGPCQGQTLGTAFTAIVECIANPLP